MYAHASRVNVGWLHREVVEQHVVLTINVLGRLRLGGLTLLHETDGPSVVRRQLKWRDGFGRVRGHGRQRAVDTYVASEPPPTAASSVTHCPRATSRRSRVLPGRGSQQ